MLLKLAHYIICFLSISIFNHMLYCTVRSDPSFDKTVNHSPIHECGMFVIDFSGRSIVLRSTERIIRYYY